LKKPKYSPSRGGAIIRFILKHLRPCAKTPLGKKIKGIGLKGKFVYIFIYSSIPLLLCSCSTTATRNGDTLTLNGIGKAVWKDGTSIEGKPMISFPQLPQTIIGK